MTIKLINKDNLYNVAIFMCLFIFAIAPISILAVIAMYGIYKTSNKLINLYKHKTQERGD